MQGWIEWIQPRAIDFEEDMQETGKESDQGRRANNKIHTRIGWARIVRFRDLDAGTEGKENLCPADRWSRDEVVRFMYSSM